MTEEQYKTIKNIRKSLDLLISKISNSPIEINDNISAIRVWTPGIYTTDDVRTQEGIPYKCIQTHDSTNNEAWYPSNSPALWTQYHGTTRDTARPWIQPTGAHNIYKTGEYMIFTDNEIYECLTDTNFSPTEYSMAWEKL